MTLCNLHAILYVSESRLRPADAQTELRSIVKVSADNNAARQITGALMFTEDHFAQYVEGPPGALRELLCVLRADQRHAHMRLLIDRPTQERIFGPWALAYHGPPDFVRAEVGAAMQGGGEAVNARLVDMMLAFSAATRSSAPGW